MNMTRDIDQLLRAHFEDRADRTVVDRQLEAILERTAGRRQRPKWQAVMSNPFGPTRVFADRPALPRAAVVLIAIGLLLTLAFAAAIVAGYRLNAGPPVNGKIVFGRFEAPLGGTVIYTVDPDGSNLVLVRPEVHQLPHWSPDGRSIGVANAVMNADGSGYRAFAIGPLSQPLGLGCFGYSPDGARRLCEGWNDADPTQTGLYTVRATDGGDPIQVTTAVSGHDIPGSYSPDGTRIAFVGGYPGSQDQAGYLMVVSVDGTGQSRLGVLTVQTAAWSRDGASILVGSAGRIYEVDVKTGAASKVSMPDAPNADVFGPTWSPDGTRILFRIFDGKQADVYTMRPDGSDVVQVTNDPADEYISDWGTHPLGE